MSSYLFSSPPTVTSLSSLPLPPAWELARRAEELMRQGDEAGARELLEALAFREQASSSPPTVAAPGEPAPSAPTVFLPAEPEPPTLLAGPAQAGAFPHHRSSPEALWVFSTAGPVYSSPAVSGNTLFCGSDDRCIYAIRWHPFTVMLQGR